MACLAASLLVTLLASLCAYGVLARDPELLTDFQVPDGVNASTIDGSFFTFTGFRGGVDAPAGTFGVKKAFVTQFPALNGTGVAYAILEYRPKTLNPVHTHPRATELLYVTHGILHVGFVDTTNKLYEQKLMPGDLFVFPKGLVHYQINLSGHKTAKAVAAFSSASPGVISLPGNLFGSGISSTVLEKAFSTGRDVIETLEKPFANPV